MTTLIYDESAPLRARFEEFVRLLATELGATLAETREHGYAVLALADVSLDVSLITYGPNKGKVKIGLPVVRWQETLGGRTDHHYTTAGDVTRYGELVGAVTEIGASMARGPDSVAKDIVRRLLPDARKVWAAMLARRDDALSYFAKTQDALARVAAAAGRAGRDNGEVYLEHGTCRVSGDSVTFDRLTVSVEKALRLIAIINE